MQNGLGYREFSEVVDFRRQQQRPLFLAVHFERLAHLPRQIGHGHGQGGRIAGVVQAQQQPGHHIPQGQIVTTHFRQPADDGVQGRHRVRPGLA